MQISSVGGAGAAASVQATQTKRNSSIPPANGAAPAATKNISPGGNLMGKLQQLLAQDPAKFKEIVSKMASDVKTAAGKATGDQASFLTKLADNLSKAADTGSMTPLQTRPGGPGGTPPGGPAAAPPPGGAKGAHKHHGGHHGGGAGGAMQSIVQSALTQVDQALAGATSATPAAAPAAATAPTAPTAPTA